MLRIMTVLAVASVYFHSSPALASGFAEAVAAFEPGTGGNANLNDAAAALGEPSRETPGQFGGPVDPFSPPYLAEQLVSIGTGGALTVEFATPIENDPRNPFGLDLIVFGNAGFIITNGNYSGGGITDGSLFAAEDGSGEVWVSEDGAEFFRLSPALAPTLDGLFPTDGSGDFHIPVDPSFTGTTFAGQDLTGIRARYAGSGGGTGFDLGWARNAEGEPVDLSAVRFVRVEVLAGHIEIDGFADAAPGSSQGIPEIRREFDFASDPLASGWTVLGDADLFRWDETGQAVEVTWDSSRTNSYFALPLGVTLHREDDFTIGFTFELEDIAIGVDPAKPYTFQIAAGLIHMASATNPEMQRASGINPEHGPRNLVEWTYFPDSGFGATVGPVVVSRDNQMAFSNNYPLELQAGKVYRVEMSFSPETQTLTTAMWEDGAPFGMGPEETLQELLVPESFTEFAVNAFAISSYSDAGQSPPEFAGSILAHARLEEVTVVLRNKPALAITPGAAPVITFPSETGWDYVVERSSDGISWLEVSGPLAGGGLLRFQDDEPAAGMALYRVRGVRQAAQ